MDSLVPRSTRYQVNSLKTKGFPGLQPGKSHPNFYLFHYDTFQAGDANADQQHTTNTPTFKIAARLQFHVVQPTAYLFWQQWWWEQRRAVRRAYPSQYRLLCSSPTDCLRH